MKNKVARSILITILVSMLSYSIAQACSLIAPTILVKCSNLKTPILAHESRAIGETSEDFQKRVIDQTIMNLHAVTPQCKEDLTPVLDMFEQEIVKWIEFKNRRILLDRDLILESYSLARESEIQKSKDDLLSCRYEESKHVGSWLIVFEKGRSYCYTYWYNRGGMCPVVILSLGHFLFYLVTNLNLVSLPYLVGLFLMGGAIIYVWWKLLKNQSTIQLNKIVALSAIILVIEFFLIVMPFWVLGQIIGWILLFFLAVLWYKRWKVKGSASRSTAG